MAVALLRHKPLHPRPISSHTSPFPPPPSDPNSSADPPPAPTTTSHFADIGHRLKSFTPTSPPRRIPASPPRPAFTSPSPAAPSSSDVRRSLNLFRHPQPSTAASPTPSFLDIFTSSRPTPTTRDTGGGTNVSSSSSATSFDALRRSLDRLGPMAGPLPGAGTKPHGLKSLFSQPQPQGPRVQPLPESVFGRELKEKDHHGGSNEGFPHYSYEQLGKRLAGLRPAGAGKDGKEWFSLDELHGRLGRLQQLDKEDSERAARSAMGFDPLRNVLANLSNDDQKKKRMDNTMLNMSLFMGLGGKATPTYMVGKPQEELLERYFHPDHMSSVEKMKLELQRVRDEFKMSENDCGSARVQVAQLTTKIKHLSATLHKKDRHSRKGLQEMVQRRKKCLKYLRRTDWDSYCLILSKFGLRDIPEYKASDYKSKSSTKTKTKKKSKRKMKA